jgi:hypothetical protein
MSIVITEADLVAMQAKMAAKKRQDPEEDVPDEGPESILQGKIMKYCKESGFPCLCFRQSKKAKDFLVPGWPD